jgi:hypothetical protein
MNNILDIINNEHRRYDGDLKWYFKKIMESPNANMSYHNVRHTLHVLWEAYDGGIQYNIGSRYLRVLLIAALYHDYDHTGKINEGGDLVNIERAVNGFKQHSNLDNNPYKKTDKVSLEEIEILIRCTEYPYRKISTGIITDSRIIDIIRDADMSQTFSPVWMQSILYGLGTELGKNYKEMLEMQIPFLENLDFKTSWAKLKFGNKIPERIHYIKNMLDIINLYGEEETPEIISQNWGTDWRP